MTFAWRQMRAMACRWIMISFSMHSTLSRSSITPFIFRKSRLRLHAQRKLPFFFWKFCKAAAPLKAFPVRSVSSIIIIGQRHQHSIREIWLRMIYDPLKRVMISAIWQKAANPRIISLSNCSDSRKNRYTWLNPRKFRDIARLSALVKRVFLS